MGLICHVKELMKALAISLENSLTRELELYDRVTEEEFEIVRQSKSERRKEILTDMSVSSFCLFYKKIFKKLYFINTSISVGTFQRSYLVKLWRMHILVFNISHYVGSFIFIS